MGLILASLSAASGTLHDQYKEFIYCDSIPSDVIAVKGMKKSKGFTGFKEIDNNVISDGSLVTVADGQCVLIVEQGKVVEICSEPGEYKYDTSLEPSIFTSNLGDGIKNVFNEIGARISYGGIAAKDQRVYYFNTKEIPGNKYGTPNPVPFRVVDRNIGLDIDIAVKCFGEYSIKVTNPILFYTNVCGNFDYEYKIDEIKGQLRTELLSALQPAFARISDMGIRYSSVPAHTMELADSLNDVLSKKWKDLRGIEIVSFGVSSIKASEEDELMIKQAQRNAMYKDQSMAAATLVGAQAQAMQDAAKNSNGAAMGFMGMNMANNAGGINANQLYQNANTQKPSPQPQGNSWTCSCGSINTGKFCPQCGAQRTVSSNWYCPECGHENEGKFCPNCGTKKPE